MHRLVTLSRMRGRAQLRRNLAGFFALSLLIAISGAVVLTAVAGARRTQHAPTAFREHDGTPDFIIATEADPEHAADKVRAISGVASVATGAMVPVMPFTEGQLQYMPVAAATDEAFGTKVWHGVLLEGRRLDPRATDEILLSELHARRLHMHAGDALRTLRFTTAQGDACFGSEPPAECEALRVPKPENTLRVVGIVRGATDLTASEHGISISQLPKAFFDANGERLGWQAMVMVNLAPGVSASKFPERVTAAFGDQQPEIIPIEPAALTDSVTILAVGLRLFALVAAIAAAFAIGQAVVRQIAAGAPERRLLLALGSSRAETVRDAVFGVVPAALAGSLVAVTAALIASRWFPIGIARRVTPAHGFEVDALAFGATLIGMIGFVVIVAGLTARIRDRAKTVPASQKAGRFTVHASPPATLGLQYAGAGRRDAVPTRSALAAVVAATTGVVAVLVFAGALAHLVDTPSLYGWSWHLMDIADTEDNQRTLVDAPAVEAVALLQRRAQVLVEGRAVTATSLRPVKGTVAYPIIEGGAVAQPNEIVLGRDTLAAIGAQVGDDVTVQGVRGTAKFKVVGITAFTAGEDDDPLADGVALQSDALTRLVGRSVESDGENDYAGSFALVARFAPSADAAARAQVQASIKAFDDDSAPFRAPVPPPEVKRLEQVKALPYVLAAFLAALGVIAVFHTMFVGVRRRNRDYAVLRTLGFRPRDVRATVVYEAGAIAVVGAAVGLPLGVLFGRLAWGRVASDLGVLSVVRIPPAALAAVPLAVAVALLIALIPARRASVMRPARALRTE